MSTRSGCDGGGRTYYNGFMGRCRVALVAGGREHKGEMVKVWNLILAE